MGLNKHHHTTTTFRPVVLILTSFVLIFLEKNNPAILANFRTHLFRTTLPVLNFLYAPLSYLSGVPTRLHEYLNLQESLKILKERNKALRKENIHLQAQQVEYKLLAKKLRYRPHGIKLRYTGRVVFTTGQPYQHSMIIRGGTVNNIRKNSSVIYRDHLVGRVLSSTLSSSHVLLIHDTISRIPVVTEKTTIQGIIRGTGNRDLKLTHVLNAHKLLIGEKLYTTGKGGIFAPNILVGKIARIVKNEVFVKTPVRKDMLDFVFVVDPPLAPQEKKHIDEKL
ncbi:MAG: rod shape-determining protein MreC [Alphaproteobacteria bacterium]|nr:MAG: rod shape-determining protein MreC [Alphaproteobacteria bacterium]